MAVYGDKDAAAVKSPEFKAVAETYGKLRDYVDRARPAATGTTRPRW